MKQWIIHAQTAKAAVRPQRSWWKLGQDAGMGDVRVVRHGYQPYSCSCTRTANYEEIFFCNLTYRAIKKNTEYLQKFINALTPNDHYRGRTAPLTSKRCILYIYSTNIGTEYFKHGIYSPFFLSSKYSLFHNSNVFGSCIIHILYTRCAKIKKKIIPTLKG